MISNVPPYQYCPDNPITSNIKTKVNAVSQSEQRNARSALWIINRKMIRLQDMYSENDHL